jgi:hypothetical protein
MFTPPFSSDAEVLTVTNISENYCQGYMQPHVSIRNNGANPLTSIDIIYTINSEDPIIYQWTGNLDFLESETVVLPESYFTVINTNTLNVAIENPGGQTDEYPKNNVLTMDIPKAPNANPTITLILKLDSHPEETTWEFKNSSGEVLFSGGPYSTAGQQIVQQFQFPDPDCYIFNIYDAGGDGLTGGGSYAIGFGSTIIVQGNAFGSKAEGQFTTGITGLEDLPAIQQVQVQPNPSKGISKLYLNIARETEISYSILNILGEQVQNIKIEQLNPGKHVYDIDLTGLDEGFYFVKVDSEEKTFIEKVILSN